MSPDLLLLEEYHGTIKNIARGLSRVTVVCSEEDLVQEGCLILMKAAKTYDPTLGEMKPYLHYKIKYGLIDILRSQTKDTQWGAKKKISIEMVEEFLLEENELGNVEEQILKWEQRQQVIRVLGNLPERDRLIMIDRFYDGLPVQDIAKKYNLSNGRISQVIKKSIEEMRKTL